MKVSYDVQGMNQFIRNVKKKSEVTQKRVDQELNRSSLRVERRAKVYAPWDTGWLSNNIFSEKQGELSYAVISPVFYSIYVELGTRYMAAQPFLYPAMQEEYWVLMRRLNKIVKG